MPFSFECCVILNLNSLPLLQILASTQVHNYLNYLIPSLKRYSH